MLTTILRTARQNSTPSVVLFDGTKSTRQNIGRTARHFAKGLLPYTPARQYTDRTAADEAWLLADEMRRQEMSEFRHLASRPNRLMSWDEQKAAMDRENELMMQAEAEAKAFNAELDRRAAEAAYLDEYAQLGCNRS